MVILLEGFSFVYRTAITELVMQGGHATCNGTVVGAMLGCKVGYSELPRDWIDGLLPKQVTWLNAKLNSLLDMMALPWQPETSESVINHSKDHALLEGFSELCYVTLTHSNSCFIKQTERNVHFENNLESQGRGNLFPLMNSTLNPNAVSSNERRNSAL